MLRPSADPSWEAINPIWRNLDGRREYEIRGDVETPSVNGHHYVTLSARSVGDTAWFDYVFHYDTPGKAYEIKKNIERYAFHIIWSEDQVPVGRLPQ